MNRDSMQMWNELNSSQIGTIEVDGFFLSYKSKGKYHVCKRDDRYGVRFFCMSFGPDNPNRRDTSAKRMIENGSVDTPEEYLQHQHICQRCQQMVEREYELRRMLVALPEEMAKEIEAYQDA